MGAYIKIDDDAKYYQPTCVTDSLTDRADEIAVGSNGGGKGYIEDSGAQDTPMFLSIAEKNLMGISQGFLYRLGSFSNVWAGAGCVKLRLTDSDNRVILKEFLTSKSLSNYEYAVELVVVDGAGHIVKKTLNLTPRVLTLLLENGRTLSR